MFENIMKFFKNLGKKEKNKESSDTAKERLHLVLMQDRANVSADFLELMKQEIIEVIKKYIDIDEKAIDVHLTNKTNDDGTVGAPALYANIPIVTIKNEARVANVSHEEKEKVKPEAKSEQVEKIEKNEEATEQIIEDNKANSEENEQTEEILEEAEKIKNEVEKEQSENDESIDKETENIEVSENIEEKENVKNTEKGETKEIETEKEEQNVGENV